MFFYISGLRSSTRAVKDIANIYVGRGYVTKARHERLFVIVGRSRTTPGKLDADCAMSLADICIVILPNGKTAPSLLSLPEDILRRILCFLLNAADVRVSETERKGPRVYVDQNGKPVDAAREKDENVTCIWSPPTKRKFEPSYDFLTAILQTNRLLYELGSYVLQRTHFVLVSTNSSLLLQDLAKNLVWHRQ